MNRDIYLPPDVAALLDEHEDLNISAICQDAIRTAVEARTLRCTRCGNALEQDQPAVDF
jgi:hypothetical protein